LYYCGVLGGWIPVHGDFGDRAYCLHLFADESDQSEKWVIYLLLLGRSLRCKDVEDGWAFLHGKAGTTGDSSLKQFALDYPDGRIEMHSERGVQTIMLPAPAK